jgi:excisionase family DNA binding protein
MPPMTAIQAPPHVASPEPLVKKPEVAKALAVTERYVGILTEQGRIPSHKFGSRCIRYRLSEVLKALGAEVKA